MLNNPAARSAVSGIVEPPARLLLRMRVTPDAVTLVGTLGAVAVARSCASRRAGSSLAVMLLFVLT